MIDLFDLFALQQIGTCVDDTEASTGPKMATRAEVRSPLLHPAADYRLLIALDVLFPTGATVSLHSGVEVTFDLFDCVYNDRCTGVNPLRRRRHVTVRSYNFLELEEEGG